MTLWCMVFIDMIGDCSVWNWIWVAFSCFICWGSLSDLGGCHCLYFLVLLGYYIIFFLFWVWILGWRSMMFVLFSCVDWFFWGFCGPQGVCCIWRVGVCPFFRWRVMCIFLRKFLGCCCLCCLYWYLNFEILGGMCSWGNLLWWFYTPVLLFWGLHWKGLRMIEWYFWIVLGPLNVCYLVVCFSGKRVFFCVWFIFR